jgi:hypothetical protein
VFFRARSSVKVGKVVRFKKVSHCTVEDLFPLQMVSSCVAISVTFHIHNVFNDRIPF